MNTPQVKSAEEESYDDEMEVVPLRLFKRSNQDQMEKLFRIVRLLPDTIHWYLENFIFPSYMRHQVMKLSACGQVNIFCVFFLHRN